MSSSTKGLGLHPIDTLGNVVVTTPSADQVLVYDGSNWTNQSISVSGSLDDGDYGDIVVTSSGTVISIDSGVITAAARTVLDDATIGDMRTTLGLAIGSNVQAYDAELAALASTTSAADALPYFTGSGTATTTTLTAAARTILDDTTVGAIRTTLGVGTSDSPVFGNVQFSNNTGIQDDSAKYQIKFSKTTSAVNYINITNAATAGTPTIAGNGTDSNVGILFGVKGTGVYTFGASSTTPTKIVFLEQTTNGTNKITVSAPDSIASDYTFTLPSTAGTVDYVLRTDGSGTTSWVAQSAGGGGATLGQLYPSMVNMVSA